MQQFCKLVHRKHAASHLKSPFQYVFGEIIKVGDRFNVGKHVVQYLLQAAYIHILKWVQTEYLVE